MLGVRLKGSEDVHQYYDQRRINVGILSMCLHWHRRRPSSLPPGWCLAQGPVRLLGKRIEE